MGVHADLEPGAAYVIREPDPDLSYALFERQVSQGVPGLVLTRQQPDRLRGAHALGESRIVWLARGPGGNVHDPSDLDGLAELVRAFIHDHRGKGVVLLDGLEYLIANSSALQTAAFLGRLHTFLADKKAVLFVTADPQGVEEREWTFLTQGLRVLEPAAHRP